MAMFGHRKVPCGLQILNPLFSLSIFAALSSVAVTAAFLSPHLPPGFWSCIVLGGVLFFCSNSFLSLSLSDVVIGDPINNGGGATASDMIGSSNVDFSIPICSCINAMIPASSFNTIIDDIHVIMMLCAILISFRSSN